MAESSNINDRDFDLLKKITNNAAIAADAATSSLAAVQAIQAQTDKFNFDGTKLKTDATLVAGSITVLETHITDGTTDIPVSIVVDGADNAMVVKQNSQPLPDGAATEAKQDVGNGYLQSLDSKFTSPISVSGPATNAELRATPLPVSGTVTATGPLTDTQLRATSVPVSGPLTDTQLRATPLPVSGTVTATGPLTNTELRATPVTVAGTVTASGPATNAELRASPLPISGIVTANGPLTDTQLRASPVSISGTVTATGPLTDTQLRATAVPVSGTVTATGPLTDTQLRATPVPVSGTVAVSSANVSLSDSANIDAFSRLRTSSPVGLFDAQFTYNLVPLQYEAIATNGGSGTATVTHDSVNRCASMQFTFALTGAKAYMQSYDYMRYQPGRSQIAFVTFNFVETATNVLKFAGLSDFGGAGAGVGNGIEFQLNGDVKQWTIYSDTLVGDETITQANWNLDKLDGTGRSGITLDITKTQIAVIDLQALYVGRVRVGFDIGGVVIYCHEFKHANVASYPYIQNASLPIKCGMTSTGTVSTTMRFICAAVISEGGQEDVSGVSASALGTATAANGADTHILSVRPKTTFNSIANRTKLIPESIDFLVTGNNPVIWKLVIGQVLSGTTAFADVNAANSAFEFNTAGTASGSPALVLQQGFIPSTSGTKGNASNKATYKVPITLDAAGAVRANGTLSILVQGVGANSACQAIINWKELR